MLVVPVAEHNSALTFHKAGNTSFFIYCFSACSNIANFIFKEKNVANKLFVLLEISEEVEERGGLTLLLFQCMLYHSNKKYGTGTGTHKTREKQEWPEADLYLVRVVLCESCDNSEQWENR